MAEVDILGPSKRRRIWGAQKKAALLAEIDAEGGKVRLAARRHGISESLLYNVSGARAAHWGFRRICLDCTSSPDAMQIECWQIIPFRSDFPALFTSDAGQAARRRSAPC